MQDPSLLFVNMVQQSRKTIVVTGETFETLRNLGTVTESFNDVILRLIEKSKAKESETKGSPVIQQWVSSQDWITGQRTALVHKGHAIVVPPFQGFIQG